MESQEKGEEIGIVGVGAIGLRMARRLMAHGHGVTVFDRGAAALETAAAAGASIAASPAAVARAARIVITCVTDAGDVEEVVAGPSGLGDAPVGLLVIETTTSLPSVTRRLGALLEARGGAMVDAPVSRGVPAAEAGTLSIMLGGAARDTDRAEPVLRLLGTDIVRTGALGSGHAAKSLNMFAMGVNLVAVSALVGLGRRAGGRAGDLVAALEAGPGGSFMTASHYPKYVLSGTLASTFTLGLMRKDIAIAAALARDAGVAAPLCAEVLALYDALCAEGLAGADNTLVFRRVEDATAAASGRTAMGAERLGFALAAVTLAGLLEAFAVARAAGLAPLALALVLAASSGGSRMGSRVALPALRGEAASLRLAPGALVAALDQARAALAGPAAEPVGELLAAAARTLAAAPGMDGSDAGAAVAALAAREVAAAC
ncbi:NAD(P)-dependent oxidoreductase [Xanthobacter sp. KR7-225]|uniref:NAD(P)-dependent oxidoreductase n=1 Tax=Xanthobacter sp. KR7-225 TaxID=3156613 RepID=UPI0032B4A9BD